VLAVVVHVAGVVVAVAVAGALMIGAAAATVGADVVDAAGADVEGAAEVSSVRDDDFVPVARMTWERADNLAFRILASFLGFMRLAVWLLTYITRYVCTEERWVSIRTVLVWVSFCTGPSSGRRSSQISITEPSPSPSW
jgi:hypothetical protein